MKKVLSLVLAFAMILGSFGFVFASDFPDVPDTEYYSEPVNVLSGFGVIGGFPDGTFGPEKEVTRAQMATMIVNALGMSVNGKSDTKFSDVPASHWASGFIAYATSVGFVAGYPDGTFKPDTQVTYDQALTMIVAALGYSAESLPGTWPGSFVNKAQGLGILDICKTTGTTNAPRQDIACFLYKALTQPIGYTDKDGAFHTNIGSDGGNDTMIKRLGATPYNNGKAFVVKGNEPTSINLKEYLGAFITAYQNGDGDIIAIKEVKSEFIEGAWKASAKTVDGKKFDEAATLKAPTLTTDDWTGSYVGFLNGDVDTTVTDWTYSADSVKVAAKLNGSKVVTVYSVQVWNANNEFMAAEDVQDELAEEQTLGGNKFAMNDDDEIDMTSFELVGKDALADIAEDDVVTVYLNKKNEIAKIEVSDKTIEGAVAKISTGTTKAYTIDGEAYYLSTFATPKAKALAVKEEGTYYLNYAGDIFQFEATSDTNTNYAVVLAAGDETSALDGSTASIRLFLADGTTKDFVVKDFQDSTKTIDIVKNGKWITTNTPNTKPAAGTLVKYDVNSSDKITNIIPATAGVGTDFDANGVIGSMILKEGTPVFSYNGGDKASADSYEVLEASKLYDAKVFSYTELDDGNGNFKALLVTGISSGTTAWAMFISDDENVADGAVEWTALYEGKVQTITVASTAPALNKTTSAAAAFYKLTVDSDGTVTDAKAPSALTPAVTPVVTPIVPTDTTGVSGNVFTAEGANYSLSADGLEVYVYDASDDEWTAKAKSAMAGRASAFKSITLYDMDGDGKIDIVLIVKP